MTAIASLAADATFTVDASHATGKVSPTLYGLMTEEINHCYDGGLYAELIHNRAFRDNANSPTNWSVMTDGNSAASIALDWVRRWALDLPVVESGFRK